MLIAKDTSSLKLLEEQSKLASMGEMIGNIAHQWRQPLSIISTTASGMKLQSEMGIDIPNNELIRFSEDINSQAQYLSKTIDNFRNFLKANKNYLKIKVENIFETVFSLTNATIKNNHITLVSKIENDIAINGSINELCEAFINIINNSKDILKERVPNQRDRFIFLNVKKTSNNKVEIKIKDSGGGIAKDIINRIFEPYFTTKHKSIGTGLGLSMADKIIRERHKGSISVYNEEYQYKDKKYKGACFLIVFNTI